MSIFHDWVLSESIFFTFRLWMVLASLLSRC